MRILTWNVNQRQSRDTANELCRLIDEEADADLVALQEVGWGRDEDYERDLEKRGYQWFYSRRRGDEGLYGCAIAVRKSLGRAQFLPRIEMPYPELSCAVAVDGVGSVASVHIPNGAGNGWNKIKTWEQLIPWLMRRDGPLILAGDFNAPGIETARETLCYGTMVEWDGEWTDSLARAAHELGHERAAELNRRLFSKWTFDGVSDTGERWEKAEAWIYSQTEEHGLVDAYRTVRGYGKQNDDYSHLAGHKTPVRYDHVFLRGLVATAARYRVDWLEARWSDHAPLVVEAC
jgi:endonuclease/exonuclease/phosphatase (EEP) superfamily protein YafD